LHRDGLLRAVLNAGQAVDAFRHIDRFGLAAFKLEHGLRADVHAGTAARITGKIAFDKNGDTTNKAITVYKVENGKWVAAVIPGQ
jgi:ABC-type branched-subunit amino acid transport system substrate-binding protein